MDVRNLPIPLSLPLPHPTTHCYDEGHPISENRYYQLTAYDNLERVPQLMRKGRGVTSVSQTCNLRPQAEAGVFAACVLWVVGFLATSLG